MSDSILSGRLPNELANEISDSIAAFLQRGMEADEVVCIVAAVAADYARGIYGPGYLEQLASIVKQRAAEPMPKSVPI